MTITMYGADWCQDCRRAKAFFTENDVLFDYVDAEETPEATDVILQRNGGIQRIPVIVFDDDSHLTEPSNTQLATKLADLANGDTFIVLKNAEAGQFELHRNREIVSVADFVEHDGVVTIPHVTTLPEHRGQGNAGRLMDGVLQHIRISRGTIVPRCPFAASHIRDNPHWQHLLASAA